jgi:hypothetical protein
MPGADLTAHRSGASANARSAKARSDAPGFFIGNNRYQGRTVTGDASGDAADVGIESGNRRLAEPLKILGMAGTNRQPLNFLFKCSHLARGESMKDPAGAFGCRWGFSLWDRSPARPPPAMRSELPAHSARAGTNRGSPDLTHSFPNEGQRMPAWLEILLNVMAFAGFIVIANYHKAPGGKLPDR